MSGNSWLAALTGLILIGAGCGQSVPSEHSITSVEESVTTSTSVEFEQEELLNVPLEEWDLAYACPDIYPPEGGDPDRFSVEELEQVFSSHASQKQLDRVFQQGEFEAESGPPTDWYALGPDLLLAADPLDLVETTFLVAPFNPEYPFVDFAACRLTRSNPTGGTLRSPVWQAVQPTVSGGEQIEILVPDCGTELPGHLEIASEVVGAQLVVTVRDPRTCDPGARTDKVAVVIDVPLTEGTVTVVDGAYWPWTAPIAATPPTGVPLSQSFPSCTSQFAAPGLSVIWSGVPGATTGQIMFDGVPAEGLSFSAASSGVGTELDNAMNRRVMILFGEDPDEFATAGSGSGALGTFGDDFSETTLASITLTQFGESMTIECEQIAPPVLSCLMVLTAGIPAAVIGDQYGEPGAPIGTFYRDGEAVTLQGFEALDPGASPGGTYHYTVRLGMNPAGVEEMDCGTIEVPTAVTGTEELTQARTIYQSIGIGPYEYVSFELICDGCPNSVWDGAGEHATFGGEADWEIVDREGQLAVTEIPLAVYPDIVHRVLIDAIALGADVEYTIDRASGVPVQWTIDGVGIRYLCVNFDTRLPDMMPNGRCQEKYNALGN